MLNKKGLGVLGWILVILIILIIGAVVYFAFFSGGSILSGLGGSSIPQPPALPTG
jgi:hypothetical protein